MSKAGRRNPLEPEAVKPSVKVSQPILCQGGAGQYRISGHESFPCRYTWLPKAVRWLKDRPKLFSDEAEAMVALGVGKNMVRSMRFWAQATGVISSGYEHATTEFGSALLEADGLDPFLEDIRTLWLIHWQLSANPKNPLLAWDFLLNHWQEPELLPSRALKALQEEAAKHDGKISPATVGQHLDTFLHTYVPTRGRKGVVLEDNLDCPLVELELIVKVGERPLEPSAGRAEPIYAFRREEKPDITPELFAYFLNDFWGKRHPSEETLPLQVIAHGHGSPGQVLKLPEEDIRARVDGMAAAGSDLFTYTESANLQQVRRSRRENSIELLKQVYRAEATCV